MEAIEWAYRCPASEGEMIELRQVYELIEYGIEPESDLAEQAKRIEAGIELAGRSV